MLGNVSLNNRVFPCGNPMLAVWCQFSHLTYLFKMGKVLNVATVMPPKMTILADTDYHSINPKCRFNRFKPSMLSRLDVILIHVIVAFIGITHTTNATCNF